MSQSQEHKESLKRKKRRVFEESPPIPSLGECSSQGQALQRAPSSSLSQDTDERTESATKRRKAQKWAKAIWEMLERESKKPDCPFRDWEYACRFFGKGQEVKGKGPEVNFNFIRDVHREIFDPILELPNERP